MSDATLQAYLDGELAPGSSAAVAAHVGACERCADELHALASVSERLTAALVAADRPPPDVERAYRSVLRRASVAPERLIGTVAQRPNGNGGAGAVAPFERRPAAARRLAGSRPAIVRAAIMLLAFAGIASAAVPGSPVRDWVAAAWTAVDQRLRPAPPPAVPAEVVEVPPALPSPVLEIGPGVAVPLAQGAVVFIFDRVPEGARVRIRMIEGERAAVHTLGSGPIPHFGTAPGRIHVSGGGATEFVVEIPRSADRARVEAGGRVLFSKSGDQVNMRSAPDSEGAEILVPLTP